MYQNIIIHIYFVYFIYQMKSIHTLFTNMVEDTIVKGLRNYTYILRAKLLANIFPMQHSTLMNKLQFINCNANVGWLAQKLFKEIPSITEKSVCAICEYNNIKHLIGLQIEDTQLKKSKSESFILDFCTVPDSTCPKCNSPGVGQNKLIEIGK